MRTTECEEKRWWTEPNDDCQIIRQVWVQKYYIQYGSELQVTKPRPQGDWQEVCPKVLQQALLVNLLMHGYAERFEKKMKQADIPTSNRTLKLFGDHFKINANEPMIQQLLSESQQWCKANRVARRTLNTPHTQCWPRPIQSKAKLYVLHEKRLRSQKPHNT